MERPNSKQIQPAIIFISLTLLSITTKSTLYNRSDSLPWFNFCEKVFPQTFNATIYLS